jgi:hypothetical protein
MDDRELKYEVYVDDNYHYMDESERYSGGVFDSWEAAEAKCRLIVDEFLVANYKEGMAADELLRQYKSYGEDPWILPPGDDRRFSAWDYAAERCQDICREKKV